MSKTLSTLIVIVIVIGFPAIGMIAGGRVPALVFSMALVGGLIFWLATTAKVQVDPQKIIVPYLLAVVLFIVHVNEEYRNNFAAYITNWTGFHLTEKNFLTVSAFVAPILWLTGAILVLMRTPVGYYMLSFFFVAMTISELAHFVFPFVDGTLGYNPGLHTAALPLIPAGYGIYVVIRETRQARQGGYSHRG